MICFSSSHLEMCLGPNAGAEEEADCWVWVNFYGRDLPRRGKLNEHGTNPAWTITVGTTFACRNWKVLAC